MLTEDLLMWLKSPSSQVAFTTLERASAYSVQYMGPISYLLHDLNAPACLR